MRTFSVLCCLIVVYISVANAAKQAAGTASDTSDDTAASPTTTTTEATTTTTEADATTTTQATTTTTQSSDTCQECDQNVVVIDLETNGGNLSSAVTGSVDGITVTSYTDPSVADPCDARALVEVDFQRVCDNVCFTGCIRGTNCAQHILRVDLEYNDISNGWLFDIGDSATNNGYGGDGSTQQNDAELQCLNGNVTLFTNDKCNSTAIDTLNDGCNTTLVSTSTIYVSNDQLRYGTNTGEGFTRCRENCLYALNGQPDSQGTVNERVFVALNRVVSNSARYGYGVCRATLRWVCPGCE